MTTDTPFQKVRNDWRVALDNLLKTHDEAAIAAFVLLTDRMLDEVVNRSMGMAIQGAGVVASKEKLDAIATELHEVHQTLNTLSEAVARLGGHLSAVSACEMPRT